MAVLVTGATGFIGGQLSRALAKTEKVVALCRIRPEGDDLDHANIRIVIGDVTAPESIVDALQGCHACIHLAGLASPWSRRTSDFYTVNTDGTGNLLDAAVSGKVKKFVFVSTAGVYGPSRGNREIVESSPIPRDLGTHYEKSKRQAELLVLQHVEEHGLDACVVCPTRVFGPGKLTQANSVTQIMAQYVAGRWWILPGDGSAIGNYVYIGDVVSGLIQALQLGQPGRRYILGGENVSYRQLFDMIAANSPDQYKLIRVPYFAAMAYAQMQTFVAIAFGTKPKITPAFVRKYFQDYRINCEFTQHQLEYQPTPIETAIAETMNWLRQDETDNR